MIPGTKSSAGQAQTSTKPPPPNVPELVGDPACKYSTRICYQPVLSNYDYCLKHILEDVNAPYRPCSFVYPNRKKCSLAAFIVDEIENSLCDLHSKIQLKGQGTPKRVAPTTPESLLAGLAHYVRPARPTKELKSPSKFRAINPFVEVDASKVLTQARADVLECASETDSDVEPATLDRIWQGANEDSSDAESVGSEIDDPLKHAGCFTAEEVLAISRKKLKRLNDLYNNQFDRLRYLYRERRRDYLQEVAKEKETLSSIYDQARTSAKEQKLYEKLKAHNRYHKESPVESLAYLASLEKRAKIGGINMKPLGPAAKCNFTEGGVQCPRFTLPLVKFCLMHVLEEKNQLLFRPCGSPKADSFCQEPVVGVGSEETCLLHVRLSKLFRTMAEVSLQPEEELQVASPSPGSPQPGPSWSGAPHQATSRRSQSPQPGPSGSGAPHQATSRRPQSPQPGPSGIKMRPPRPPQPDDESSDED